MFRPSKAAAPALGLLLGLAVCVSGFAGNDAARLAMLKSRIQGIAAETAYVEAITKIQRLGRAFGYYTDKGYFGEAADLFADDGTFQWGVDGVYKGKARIRELLTRHGGGSMKDGPGLPFGRLNLRMQLQPVVTVAADGRSAHARWREWGLLGQYKQWADWGDAVIEDDYVKENDVWKIAARRYYLNFEAPYQGGWAALKPVSGDWRSAVARDFPADAPAPVQYQPFPAVYLPPYDYAGTLRAIQSRPPIVPPRRPDDALGRLEALADAKELQLARAHSVRALENLQAMYGYYIDKGQWKQAASLFSHDGTYEFGQGGVYVGNAHIERALSLMGPQGLEAGQLNNYVMVQPIINVSDDNRTAKARWRSDVQLARAGQGRWGGGVYENEYVNDKGTWKFSKLHYYVTFWGDYDQGWVAKPFAMDPPSTAVPPDRPPTQVYQSFPKLQIVPYHYNNPVSGKPDPGEYE
ncbi:MAG TPA: nuclear transport factor 2 family protein [Steroidobacteraceae bacterium]|nr:nuclear transport factor 2 family protein [Steroidobacteraceae bacterium]